MTDNGEKLTLDELLATEPPGRSIIDRHPELREAIDEWLRRRAEGTSALSLRGLTRGLPQVYPEIIQFISRSAITEWLEKNRAEQWQTIRNL